MIEKQDHGFVFVKKRIRIIRCAQQAKEEKTAVCGAGEVYGSTGDSAATLTITRQSGNNPFVSKKCILKSKIICKTQIRILDCLRQAKEHIRKTS